VQLKTLHKQDESCLRSEAILLQIHAEAKRLQMEGCVQDIVSVQTEFSKRDFYRIILQHFSIKTQKVLKSGSVSSGRSSNDKT
jgi:hypothetical protein